MAWNMDVLLLKEKIKKLLSSPLFEFGLRDIKSYQGLRVSLWFLWDTVVPPNNLLDLAFEFQKK